MKKLLITCGLAAFVVPVIADDGAYTIKVGANHSSTDIEDDIYSGNGEGGKVSYGYKSDDFLMSVDFIRSDHDGDNGLGQGENEVLSFEFSPFVFDLKAVYFRV